MIYIAIVAAIFVVVTLQSRIWKTYALRDLEYRVEVSADEVFEDEEIYVYEELRNNKAVCDKENAKHERHKMQPGRGER